MDDIELSDIDIRVNEDGEKLWVKATHKPTRVVVFSHNYDSSGQTKEEVIEEIIVGLGLIVARKEVGEVVSR